MTSRIVVDFAWICGGGMLPVKTGGSQSWTSPLSLLSWSKCNCSESQFSYIFFIILISFLDNHHNPHVDYPHKTVQLGYTATPPMPRSPVGPVAGVLLRGGSRNSLYKEGQGRRRWRFCWGGLGDLIPGTVRLKTRPLLYWVTQNYFRRSKNLASYDIIWLLKWPCLIEHSLWFTNNEYDDEVSLLSDPVNGMSLVQNSEWANDTYDVLQPTIGTSKFDRKHCQKMSGKPQKKKTGDCVVYINAKSPCTSISQLYSILFPLIEQCSKPPSPPGCWIGSPSSWIVVTVIILNILII